MNYRPLSTIGLSLMALQACNGENNEKTMVDRWANGNPKKEATVIEGDTVEIALYDEAGHLSKISRWSEGQRHGKWEAFYPDGTPWSMHQYQDGRQVGPYQTWHPNGKPFIKGQYDDSGSAVGTWRFFDETGALIREEDGGSIHN